MLIVSHRLSSLVDCDQIMVLDQGRVADIGPHADLVQRCPTYRHLWLQQNRHMGESKSQRAGLPTAMLVQGA
jgi:ATP-binding cassette subfamily B protein